MNGDRDELDDLLLTEGRFKDLLAAYYPVVVARLLLRVGPGVAHEVASSVFLRLLEELTRGRRYPVPFRVVVWNVTRWCLKEHFTRSRSLPEVALPDDLEVAADGESDGVVGDLWVRDVINRALQGRQHEVAWLHYVDQLSIEQISTRLGITRNAVDQALHNAHANLRQRVDDV